MTAVKFVAAVGTCINIATALAAMSHLKLIHIVAFTGLLSASFWLLSSITTGETSAWFNKLAAGFALIAIGPLASTLWMAEPQAEIVRKMFGVS
ncbi:hypothetical protein [Nitrospirillum pindoramense]|uniref:hypothetical protein n=1 Tax=Nitrospirillum amazonense TaxID=28077 RepID=UPI00119E1BA6|nr:hypothetical protein [Nitrospirillum amazonense]